MSLDSVLNVLIGPIIFIALAFLIYSKAQQPIDKFFAWLGEKIRGRDQDDEKYEGSYEIDYNPVGSYNFNEEI